MKLRVLLLAALLVLPAVADLAGLAGAQGANGGPIIANESWGGGEAAPGDAARQIVITLQNSNTQSSYFGMNATVQPGASWCASPDDQFSVSVPGGGITAFSGEFKPGATWNATFTIDLASNLTPQQTMTLPLVVDGEWINGQASVPYTWNLCAYAQLSGRANLVLEPKQVALPASASVDVQLVLANQGNGNAGNILLNLTPAAGGLILNGRDNTWLVGALGPGQQQVLDVPFYTPSQTGVQSVTATLSYTNAAGVPVQATRTLSFRITDAMPGQMSLELPSNHVAAGSTSLLAMNLTNTGGDAFGVMARFNLPGLGSGSSGAAGASSGSSGAPFTALNGSDAQALGDLAAGTSRGFALDLLVARSAADLYPLSADLAWTDAQGRDHEQTINFGVQVVGLELLQGTDGRAAVDNSTDAATISGTLTNVGNAVAHNAYVSVLPGGPFAPSQPTFLGDVATNSPIGFAVTTRLLNASLAQGLQGGGFVRGQGGFGGGGAPPGTFVSGSGDAAPGNGTGTPGRFGRGNGTGFARSGGPSVTLLVTFNDDYGNQLSQTVAMPVQLRAASAGPPHVVTQTASSGLETPVLVVGLLAVAAGAYVWQKRRPKA